VKASRRGFLGSAGIGAAAGLAGAAGIAQAQRAASRPEAAPAGSEPFYGPHQAGITTPMQEALYFASFDLAAAKRQDVIGLLQDWTRAAARLTAGLPAEPMAPGPNDPPADSGEAAGLNPSRLTLTFGFGPDLFSLDGEDRYGIAALRPAALVDLPRFAGDELAAGRCGGALCVQACADDPQVAFHAVRQLARISYGAASLRWVQSGFSTANKTAGTPRNLMGFKDGTMNPTAATAGEIVWAGSEGPAWMIGHVHGGAAHPHRAGALGPDEAGVSGTDHRPAQGLRRAARRQNGIRDAGFRRRRCGRQLDHPRYVACAAGGAGE